MKLYTYFRSSAAFRARIALNLKGVAFETLAVQFAKHEQRGTEYLAKNPQGLVPALDIGNAVLSQSLAIIEYLDETFPDPPLLPGDALGRARVRSLALSIACDIHPLNNLRVLNHLRKKFSQDEAQVSEWCRHWIALGFKALETSAQQYSTSGRFLYGDAASMADVCLLPQIFNARRVETDLAPFPALVAIGRHLESLPAFADARPEVQPDAV